MFFPFLLASMLTVSDPRANLLDLLGGEWVSQGVYVAALPKSSLEIKLQGGSFFDAVPKADIYLMKSILHDWSDEKSIEILHSCFAAMSEQATLYIIEPVLMQSEARDYAKLTDVLMLAVTGGRERSLEEYRKLFDKSGFVLSNVFSTPTEFRILEVKKKAG